MAATPISGGWLERLIEICGEGFPSNFDISPEGGYCISLTNKSGAASVKGTLVEVYNDTAIDNAWDICSVGAVDCIGAVYDGGVADGSDCWIVVGGRAQVLLEDGTATTRDYWVKTSENDAGRADGSNAAPAGGTIAALEDHLQEVGHALESQSSGTDVLAYINLHFL